MVAFDGYKIVYKHFRDLSFRFSKRSALFLVFFKSSLFYNLFSFIYDTFIYFLTRRVNNYYIIRVTEICTLAPNYNCIGYLKIVGSISDLYFFYFLFNFNFFILFNSVFLIKREIIIKKTNERRGFI